ncbi:MAG: membrane protein insertase YidC [Planctomycetaceae bacterium]
MEQRRFLLFITLSIGLLVAWNTLLLPRLLPPAPQPVPGEPQDKADLAEQSPEVQPKDAVKDHDVAVPAQPVADKPPQQPPAGVPDAPDPDKRPLKRHPQASVTLGSLDPDSGYFAQLSFTTRGAAMTNWQLNDPRYRQLEDRQQPLELVSRPPATESVSFTTAINALDEQLKPFGTSSTTANWLIEENTDEQNQASVVFRLDSPDGSLQVRKRYTVSRIADGDQSTVRDRNSAGYQVQLDLTVTNTGQQRIAPSYVLQGPVGVPLENAANARKFRDFKIGTVNESLTVLSASDVVEDEELNWTDALRFVGLDTQYFAVLLIPNADQSTTPYTQDVRPQIIEKDAKNPIRSDISLQLTSKKLVLEAGQTVTHSYTIYGGPKRESLLKPLAQGPDDLIPVEADGILDYGMFSFVATAMLWLLDSLHGIGVTYGLAIIGLTIVVRGCMFPLSRKQAIGAQKMKELQPKIAELKKKHGKDKEKMARAQMELFSKHNYNPLSGCLPIFMQLPIFIGLYTALNASVDLRMASFLYIDNLAAPDNIWPNLFTTMMPFLKPNGIPFLGPNLNLLPLITIALFIAQQKMFMPPPTDDQQAMQQKMMNYMMIFFGVMFYRVPAGLCVYFIASSLWGIGERKMLDVLKTGAADTAAPNASEATTTNEKKTKKKTSVFQAHSAQQSSGNKRKRKKRSQGR